MAFTKITHAGIGSTGTVLLENLQVIGVGTFGTLSVGGTVSIGGTLTYEDVTNIDSVGLITARNGIVVGSGITLSKDGDVFFTGIATGNGSGLTALNASNISSGTVPSARLGSGTASSSTFLAGDSTFKTVTGTTINNNADNRIITGSGTANTLNGESELTYSTYLNLTRSNSDTNFGDNSAPGAVHGFFTNNSQNTNGVFSALSLAPNDVNGTNQAGSFIVKSVSGGYSPEIHIGSRTASNTTESNLKITSSREVELRYQGSTKLTTTSYGVLSAGQVRVSSSNASTVAFSAGDANTGFYNSGSHGIGYAAQGTQKWNIGAGGHITLLDSTQLRFGTDNDFQLYHDGTTNYIESPSSNFAIRVASGNRLEINGTSGDVTMQGSGGKNFLWDTSAAYLNLNDNARLTIGTSNDLQIRHDGTDSRIYSGTGNLLVAVNEFRVTRTQDDSTAFSVDQDGPVTLAYNHGARLVTLSGGIMMGSGLSEGSNEPFFVENGGTIRRRYSSTAGAGFHLTGSAIFPTTGTGSYSNGGVTWGTSSYRWGQIFSQYTNISTSDRNLKNTITTSDLGLDFVNQLKPVSYKFNRETSDRTHYGLISQDVEELLPKIGKTAMDFGGFCKDTNSRIETNADGSDSVIAEEGETYSLRYDEFISPLIKAVQELSAKNDALEARIKTLEG